ncbi:MAG: bifunctional phosphoglucose/phosphomannose isomerase [candidate division Zixibacteria bacterium]
MDNIVALKNSLDKSDMFGNIAAMPDHLLEGARLGRDADLGNLKSGTFHSLVIAGMGGSAIGGEVARSYLSEDITIPFLVQRHYNLPGFVNKKSLVICSSYSGNTEETLSAYHDAHSRGANLLVITSGGELAERAETDHVPLVTIPGGIPAPRAAFGYSLAPLLTIIFRLGLCPSPFKEIEEAAAVMKSRLPGYAADNDDNPALSLARELYSTIPIIYAGQDRLDAVATRFKGQICENAKCLAFANVFPEFNHNELVGWGELYCLEDKITALIINDDDDHPRIKARAKIVGDYLKSIGKRVITIPNERISGLSGIMLMIQLADFVSYYLALLNDVDPTPVVAIDFLKKRMSDIK